ncbi:MAG: pseudouridine synthase [Cyanobacteria bacterium P01_A01_bin.17]
MEARLQKILSQWGIASRRQAEKMIQAGQVTLNDRLAQLGDKADPERDIIEVNGDRIYPQQRPESIYLLLHKPAGVITTCHDPQQRSTIFDLLPQRYTRRGLHPVGRLDADSTGALLITNDGQLTCALTHPRYHISKTYQVRVQGCPSVAALERWRQGIMLAGRKTLPAKVAICQREGNQTKLEVILQEGRNRQIRRIAKQLGYPVLSLHRSKIGPVCLESTTGHLLCSGQYRHLTQREVDRLRPMIANSARYHQEECPT